MTDPTNENSQPEKSLEELAQSLEASSPEADEPASESPELNEIEQVDPAAHGDIELSALVVELEDPEKGDPYGGHTPETVKNIIEAALFASGTTLSVSHLRALFEEHERPHGKTVRALLAELIAAYQGGGIQLVEVASGYRFQTDAGTAQWVAKLWDEKPQRYSRALMETIALIAYRQPITRGEIEDVRGVAVSSNIVRTLLERDWVRVVGHRDVPGRPAMYATTRQFLDYFGLSSLDQLPSLSEIRNMDELNPQMDLDSGDGGEVENDAQSEISFSGLIEKIRDSQTTGKTGNQFIDEQLDDELKEMDDVNAQFEQSLQQQRAEHEHPDLDLNDGDDEPESTPEQTEQERSEQTEEPENLQPQSLQESEPQTELSEEEQWKIIQEKLAQQQALLDGRESDQQGEDDENE
ncbi:SMC-Scp complex subunit ScpB [Reinekea marinisedimentorum]|uniref:Segregation and condensation protein B n=1 Tax=Reinekea marinisedimentorum TaxID=230495 RepID=A0A4R3HSG9_9GAMM|nr:SMC-Scp complex subunit ScpB [Reinekea marinisedimentorum]TCS35888.1 segregation and condensation protein B [Reinekea marinisedimentorum]